MTESYLGDRMNRRTTIKRSPIKMALREKMHVMTAVALRDMRTRFFDHGIGFLVVPLWPLVHMLVLLLIYSLAGRETPYGDSLNVFFATGIIPTLLFMYVSRFMSLSLILNKPMLAFPVVQVVDVMIARAFLEAIAGALTLAFLLSILKFLGENIAPFDLEQAVLAYLSTLLLAVGIGSLVGVIVMFAPIFATAYALILIVVYAVSGTLFVANQLPESAAYALSFNPVLQGVEWMRTAYYPT
jgi:capsular polysaccharide transport system permease protein